MIYLKRLQRVADDVIDLIFSSNLKFEALLEI